MRNLIIQLTNRIVPAAILAVIILLAGCEQSEVERLASAGDDNNVSGKSATLSISLQGIPEYNAPDGQTRSSGSNEPLIAEWVAVNTFDATRPIEKSGEAATDEESQGPRIALMELREDTVSAHPVTRGVMPGGVYFRLIAFRKSGSGYVFQSAADYTSNGSSAPTLRNGTMNLPLNQTYRFVAYSFNNNALLGPIPASYTWNVTSISVPNMSNDFLTYVSGDYPVTGESLTLTLRFTHQLCKLTVRIKPTGFVPNTFTNCTGVYISQGGYSSSWKVGQDGIVPNTNNSASFNINDNGTATVRLVPFANPRRVTVHFGTLTVGGIVANNLDIKSSRSVQLVRGRSYTLTAQLKKRPGIVVPASEINLTANGCTQPDKDALSGLRWAEGNLKSVSSGIDNDYVWTTPYGYGYYYTWLSTFTSEGNRTINGIDPCSKLTPDIYGKGWRTPNMVEAKKLSRCTDLVVRKVNGVSGMWFMNKTTGLFMPLADARGYDMNHDIGAGCGTSPGPYPPRYDNGHYWTSTRDGGGGAWYLYLSALNSSRVVVYVTDIAWLGYTVRCVKDNR